MKINDMTEEQFNNWCVAFEDCEDCPLAEYDFDCFSGELASLSDEAKEIEVKI